MSGIFIAILNLIGVIVSSIGVVFVKEWIAKKRRKVVTNLLTSKAECWMQLDKIASNIRESLNAKGVYIAYFHNGGKFCNGINMDKFTVIAEDYDISITDPYRIVIRMFLLLLCLILFYAYTEIVSTFSV